MSPSYFETGFFVREPAWHRLGTVLDHYPGRAEAMKAAGHEWNIVELEPFVTLPNHGDHHVAQVVIKGYKALYRDDIWEPIGVVRSSYEVVSNAVLWDIVDAIVDTEKHIKYETAGVLKGGSVLWVLARLDEPVQIGNENSPTYPYILVHTSHDYSHQTACACVATRVVCWNTLNMAMKESERSGLRYTFRHTKNVMERIEDAKQALSTVRDQFSVYQEIARELCKHRTDDESILSFVNTLIPEPETHRITKRGLDNIEKARSQVLNILLDGPTIDDKHRHNAYGLFCAGIEYLDHYRKARTDESYFRRSVYDTTTAKARVAKLALECATN
jgi:phage/plasmid-like protein (TIGR03299 family)